MSDKRPGEKLAVGGAKKPRTDEQTVAGPATDPDTLTDVIFSAGVNLTEEENLLSSTLSGQRRDAWGSQRMGGMGGPGAPAMVGPSMGGMGGGLQMGQAPMGEVPVEPFLDPGNLIKSVRKQCHDTGVRYLDRDQYIMQLVSASCEEWLTSIITDAVVLSRHRRRSRNDVHSSVSKALRHMAIKDKEEQERIEAEKEQLRLEKEREEEAGGDGSGKAKKQQVSEEVQHRAANQTANMMAFGKKRYDWMKGGTGAAGGAAGAGAAAGGMGVSSGLSRVNSTGAGGVAGPAGVRKADVRYREAKEEPGVVLRDLLAAMEDRRYGVDKALAKGYVRIR